LDLEEHPVPTQPEEMIVALFIEMLHSGRRADIVDLSSQSHIGHDDTP
jgi:hypothetical protein